MLSTPGNHVTAKAPEMFVSRPWYLLTQHYASATMILYLNESENFGLEIRLK